MPKRRPKQAKKRQLEARSVHAGQIYGAKAAYGHRFVKIQQVRGLRKGAPYAIAVEILPSGRLASGWLRGVDRSIPIKIALTYADGVISMPPWYKLEEK